MRSVGLSRVFGVGFTIVLSVLAIRSGVFADVAPGDVIDKTNWQKAEGLLPASVLNWVKTGDYILNVGELNYDQKEFHPPYVLDSLKANLGKYDVNEKDLIIEKDTGKAPKYIVGIPFPEIDPADPKAGQKCVYNKDYTVFSLGNVRFPVAVLWIGSSGFERQIRTAYMNAPLDGYPGARSLPNPDDMQRYVLIPVTEPYDIAGFNLLLWRYRDERQDVNLAYIPAIRRIRRMSPANRSDSFVGSDFCVDDPWGYDGRVLMFEWKFLRKQEALVAYQSVDPELIVPGKRKGEWQTTQEVTPGLFGYEKEGWQGAPWAPLNFVWVKKTVYVIEAVSKDPYYNYGRQEIWYDPELFHFKYKIVYDRAGKYWKTMSIGMGGCESRDKDMRLMMLNLQHMVDDRTRHAGMLEHASKRNRWVFWAEMDMNDFTLSGFQKYCK